MTEKERVDRAVHCNNPDRVPVLFFNKDFAQSDIIIADVVQHFNGENRDISEFGFVWERHDDTMGQPETNLIDDWSGFDSYTFPNPGNTERFDEAKEKMDRYGPDKYYVAGLSLSGFTVMTFLRGFENTLVELYTDIENINRLADGVFGFEEEIIRRCAEQGFSAVAFFDDWGTQNSLIISAELWREFFKPRYKRQFDLCHSLGLDVYFHCCGYIYDIIGDLIEIGVDILNLSQPNIFDIEQLGRDFGGKVCFLCPVSYQTTSLTGTKEDIYQEVKRLTDNLGCYRGGLIGYMEEYASIGLSDENYRYCKEAFYEFGTPKGS